MKTGLSQKLLRNHIREEMYCRLGRKGKWKMSEFAFFRFMSLNLLTQEEKENKTEIISVIEQVLDAEGIECDSKIAKLSEEKIIQILSEVRKRRCKSIQSESENVDEEEKEEREEDPITAT